MSKQEEAGLILKLYELRREEVMRKARSWMVVSYWEMACSLVTNGAIDAQLFNDANGEHIFYFAKLQPFLKELREKNGTPTAYQHLEKVVMDIPNIESRLEVTRVNINRMAARRAHAADQSLRV